MKKTLKILLWIWVSALVLTLGEGTTFGDILTVEGLFWSGVFVAFADWFSTVILWKYIILAGSILALGVVGLVLLIKKAVKRSKARKACGSSKRRSKVVQVPVNTVKTKNEVKMSQPGKFQRVTPKKK